MKRREFITSAAAASVAVVGTKFAAAQSSQIELEEATIASLQAAMSSRRATSRSITQAYLARIADIDKKLNSVIELNPDALAIADAMDAERKAGRVRGPLHGIPILIKDNIDTADKMKTTAGSLALVDAPTPKQDAFIVKQLRDAGAVMLGKTNLSEWANFRSDKIVQRLVGPRRTDAQSVHSRPQSVRIVLGNGCGDRGKSCGDRHRNRNRRLGNLPVVDMRYSRYQTDARACAAFRHHPDRAQPGHGRADVPHGRGRGDVADGYGRQRPE